MSAPRVRRGEVADAAEITRTLHVAQAYTYAGIMPLQFAIDRITEIPTATRERHDQLTRDAQTEAAGGEPFRRWWVAEDAEGISGVCCAGLGTSGWEAQFPPPPTPLTLDKLYLLPRAQGTGVAHRMLELALGERPAYLWIIGGNPRAERFYLRHGFARHGGIVDTGPTWFEVPMYRMARGV